MVLEENIMAVRQRSLRSKKVRRAFVGKVGTSAAAAKKGIVLPLREDFGLTRKLFSRLTGYSERAIAKWEEGETLSPASKQKMHELARLRTGLQGAIKADYIPEWLQNPNQAFDGLKPLEVIERGEVDRIWRMIYQLESGVPG
jgi:DNA-binding transcriptional regulator YiaG